jgi:cyanate permease
VLAVAGGLGSGAANALGAFLVDSLVTAGVAAARAGVLLSVGSVGAIMSRLAAGWAADRTRLDLNVLIATMMAVGGVAFLFFPEVLDTSFRGPVVLLGFAGVLGWAGVFQLAVVRSHLRAAAAATGFTQAGMYAGGLLGPILFGIAVTSVGYTFAWRAAGTAALIASLLVLDQFVRSRAPA